MEGATLYQQHEDFQKQTSNYQRLLQHAMNKFSKQKLNQMLRALSCGGPYLESSRSRHKDHPQRITSLRDLHEILGEIKATSEKKHGLQRDEELHLIKYFDTFFDDLEYLRSLKKDFDENIYVCLYDYFYDPADDVEGQYNMITKHASRLRAEDMSEDEIDSGLSTHSDDNEKHLHHYGQSHHSGKALQKVTQTQEVFVDDLSDKEKLSYAVKQLYDINQLWDKLFEEEYIDPTCFDDDSYHELLQMKDFVNYENVLRLIPDMFVKTHKSLELAKLWWTQANKVYTHLPSKGNSAVEFNKKADDMEKNIFNLREQIEKDENMLRLLRRDLQMLSEREQRFFELSDTCKEVEEEKNDLGQKHNDVLLERDALKRTLTYTDQSCIEYYKTAQKLRKYDQDLVTSQYMLDLLDYKLGILQGDFDCALRVRPDMIFFTADVAEKIAVLEEALGEKRLEVHQQEKRLVLLRTNCDRMRMIMRKYIRSVYIHDTEARRRELKKQAEEVKQVLDQPPLEDQGQGQFQEKSKTDPISPTAETSNKPKSSGVKKVYKIRDKQQNAHDEESKSEVLTQKEKQNGENNNVYKDKETVEAGAKSKEDGATVEKPTAVTKNLSTSASDKLPKGTDQSKASGNRSAKDATANKTRLDKGSPLNRTFVTDDSENPDVNAQTTTKSKAKVKAGAPGYKLPVHKSSISKNINHVEELHKDGSKMSTSSGDDGNMANTENSPGFMADTENNPGFQRKVSRNMDTGDGSKYKELFKNNKYHATDDSILNRKPLSKQFREATQRSGIRRK